MASTTANHSSARRRQCPHYQNGPSVRVPQMLAATVSIRPPPVTQL
jgi:hypothetical protein